jgi:sortase A
LNGNVYLFAHSADNFWDAGRYNAVFYLLKDLNEGDEIVIFYRGERYNYYVTGSQISDPQDVSLITNATNGGEQLVLQTCWPPGTTLKRLTTIL